MKRVLHKLMPQIPILLKLFAVYAALRAGWINFVVRDSTAERYVTEISRMEVSISIEAAHLFLISASCFVGSFVLSFIFNKLFKDHRTFALNQKGVTWKIKQLIGEGKETEAIKFVRNHYKLPKEDAEMMVKKIRFGIDATQSIADNSSIDPEEHTLTNISKLESSSKKPPELNRTKVVLQPEVAEKAMELIRHGKTHEALIYLREKNGLDTNTSKKVVEKLKKIA